MKRSSAISLLLAAAAFAVVSSSHSALLHFSTQLSGANESPPVPSMGTGTANVTIDDVAHTIAVDVEFSGLTEPTTVAHIHCCTAVPFAGNVGVATFPGSFPGFPVGVTDGTYNGMWNLLDTMSYTAVFLAASGGTAAAAEAALIQGIFDGKAYVNVHTTFAPAGEIRGFLVPEPGAIALLALALGAAFAARRRRPH